MRGLFDWFYVEVAIDRLNVLPKFKEMLPFTFIYRTTFITSVLRDMPSLPVFHPNYLSIVDEVVNRFFQLFYDVENLCAVGFDTNLSE